MNTPEQQLSDSLLAACKAAGIEKPRFVMQRRSGIVYHMQENPNESDCKWTPLIHPPYADDWQDSLLEWVEPQGEPLADVSARHPDHIADTSKMIDDACEIAYHAHIQNGNGFRWSRLDCYRAAWQDALAWKGGDQ